MAVAANIAASIAKILIAYMALTSVQTKPVFATGNARFQSLRVLVGWKRKGVHGYARNISQL
jgi:hypothetical protein